MDAGLVVMIPLWVVFSVGLVWLVRAQWSLRSWVFELGGASYRLVERAREVVLYREGQVLASAPHVPGASIRVDLLDLQLTVCDTAPGRRGLLLFGGPRGRTAVEMGEITAMR